jgi:hypothetical protein
MLVGTGLIPTVLNFLLFHNVETASVQEQQNLLIIASIIRTFDQVESNNN